MAYCNYQSCLWSLRSPNCNLPLLWVCDHPSCVEVIEIVICVCGYPSCEEVIVVVWLSALSLLCEVIVVLALCLTSRVEVVVLERGVVYSYFVFVKSLVEVPCVGGPVWT